MGRGWLTRSYNFVKKDPEIDRFRTIWQKDGIKESDLAALAGLGVGTVKKIFGGDTKSPRHSTFAKMAAAMGYEYGLTREMKPNYETEIPKAREEFREHKEMLRKKREKAAKRNNNNKE